MCPLLLQKLHVIFVKYRFRLSDSGIGVVLFVAAVWTCGIGVVGVKGGLLGYAGRG